MSAVSDSGAAVRKIRVFTAREWWQYGALSLARFGAYLFFAGNWFSAAELWRRETGGMLAITALIFVVLTVDLIRWCALPFMCHPAPMAAIPGWRLAVVTTCVPELEPRSILEPTLRALAALDYPHDTYLLDEGDDPGLQSLCRDLGIVHYSRKGKPEYQSSSGSFASHSKHGNYNSWLREIGFRNYDILLAFDPDHVPARVYASELLGYFSDPMIGYVQAPQAYGNQRSSWIARGAAEETYLYYSIVQRATFGAGDPVVTGCHSAHRLTALQQIGGFPDHDAEDLVATAKYQEAGWKGVYVPKILAHGLAPENWEAYLNQQFRWARSVLDIKVKELKRDTGSKKPFVWLQGFGYLHDAILAAVGLPLFCAMLATGWGVRPFLRLHSVAALALAAVLWLSNRYKRLFCLDRASEAGCHWRAMLLRAAKWPRVLRAYWSVTMSQRTEYVVTPKIRGTGSTRLILRPMGVVVIAVGASWLAGVVWQAGTPAVAHIWTAAVVTIAIALIASEQWESRL